jgi:pimeloyl-ACP methyl ester carboxylesterase
MKAMPARTGMTETEEWSHREAVVNGVRLHYVEAGQGPLVILLHGFPDFWYTWRLQIPPLAGAGFRVLAPDLRGYNLSDKPAGVAAYRLPQLRDDVLGLIRHAGADRATVAGHDWGGGIAWYLALTRPECLERLIILNAPHPILFQRELRRSAQLLRSWYIFLFQLPWLPELICRWHRFALLRRALFGHATRPGQEGKPEREMYLQALARPGALTAAINYYRAVFRELRGSAPSPTVLDVPTLVLWGEREPYLGVRLLEGLDRWVRHLRIERFAHAGHWVHVEAAEQVNRAMTTFLRSEDPLL